MGVAHLIPLLHLFQMSSQVRIDYTYGGMMDVESNGHTSFVTLATTEQHKGLYEQGECQWVWSHSPGVP